MRMRRQGQQAGVVSPAKQFLPYSSRCTEVYRDCKHWLIHKISTTPPCEKNNVSKRRVSSFSWHLEFQPHPSRKAFT